MGPVWTWSIDRVPSRLPLYLKIVALSWVWAFPRVSRPLVVMRAAEIAFLVIFEVWFTPSLMRDSPLSWRISKATLMLCFA